jgi:hypothetical protein
MPMKKVRWSASDDAHLKALVGSGASAARASVVLQRSITVTKSRARYLHTPFRSEIELKKARKELYQISADGSFVKGRRFPVMD